MGGKLIITPDFFRPFVVLAFTQLVCFFSWLFPSFGILRKGFTQPWDMFSLSAIMFFAAYCVVLITCYLGYFIGNKGGRAHFCNFKKRNYFEVLFLYRFFIVISILGIGGTVFKIISTQGLNFLLMAIGSGQANQLKETLYENYSVGILSLRYAGIVLIPLLILKRHFIKKSIFDLVPIILLLCIILISSRLALVFSFVLSVFVYIKFIGNLKVNIAKLVMFLFAGYIVLSALNYSRNYGYYDDLGMGFFTAGISEIITYLGAPFQGALYVFGNPIIGVNETNYPVTTIEFVLNTNSAFMHKFSEHGVVGFYYILAVIFITSFFIGLSNKKTSVAIQLMVGVLLYCFAEFWRVFLFDQGIVITLIALCAVGFVAFLVLFNVSGGNCD